MFFQASRKEPDRDASLPGITKKAALMGDLMIIVIKHVAC